MRNSRIVWGGLAVLLLAVLFLVLRAGSGDSAADVVPQPPVLRADAGSARRIAARPEPSRPPLRLMPAARVVASDALHGAFAGRVISASSGEGIAGAELTFAPVGGGATSVITGPEGSFHFSPSEAGSWQLASITAEGFLPFGPEWGRSPIWLTAASGRRVEQVTVALAPLITLQGRVEDAEGAPIAGARVRVRIASGGDPVLFPEADTAVVTGAGGAFVIRVPEEAEVEARHVGFHPAVATVSPEVVLARKLILRLDRASGADLDGSRVIAGMVVDAQGAPIPEASVRVSSADAAWPRHFGEGGRVMTDPDGRFRVGGLAEGTWDVTASMEGRAAATLPDVPSGREDVRLTLRARTAEEGVTVEGVVRAPQGAPVPSFTLSVQRRLGPLRRTEVLTAMVVDAAGQYRVPGLEPGAYAVQVAAAGLAPAEALLEIAPGEKGPVRADFQLAPGARLGGVVVDAETQQPLRGARLMVEGMRAQGELAVRFDALSDGAGAFEIDGLAEGEVSLHALAEGHHSRIIGGITVRPGPPAFQRIELRPTAEGEDPRLELMGIGAVLSAREDALIVGQVLPGGGAAEAGLAPGDALVRIDGQPVVELGFTSAVQRIRGPENSLVVLGVRKVGQEAAIEVPVTRRRIQL